MINNHHIDRSRIRFENHLPPSPTSQSHIRDSASSWSIYRVAKLTLTALGLLFSTQQLTHISARRQPFLQSGLQNRNISHPLESDIPFWLSRPPCNPDHASPVTDVFLPHNNRHPEPIYLDRNDSGQADIEDILPDLMHLFDQPSDGQAMPGETHTKATHRKQHHHTTPRGHDAQAGRLHQQSPQPSLSPQCDFTTSFEYTSQDTLTTSTLNLLSARQPSSPTVVAVIDDGIIPHRALNDRLVPGYDFISDPECAGDGDGYDDTPTDEGNATRLPLWHGTHMAGIIAGTSINKDGVSLLKNIIKIQPIRFMGRHRRCNERPEDLINGLKWAAGLPVANVPLNANPAKVINLSFGDISHCRRYKTVFKALYERNITVIAAAGNKAMPANYFLFANCPHVIAVGAQLTESSLASSSNFGPLIAISAVLGRGLMTTSNTGEAIPWSDTFTRSVGTSAAAALVSQAAALMHSVNSRLVPDDIRAILMNSSRPFQPHDRCYTVDSETTPLNTEYTVFPTTGSPGQCTNAFCGSGHLDIDKAVAFAAGKTFEESDDQLSSESQ